jgi:ABC-type polysaccharide/polyol phosphate export permease
MAVVIDAYRVVLLDGHWPHWSAIFAVIISSAVLTYASLQLLNRFDRAYAKVLL